MKPDIFDSKPSPSSCYTFIHSVILSYSSFAYIQRKHRKRFSLRKFLKIKNEIKERNIALLNRFYLFDSSNFPYIYIYIYIEREREREWEKERKKERKKERERERKQNME